MSNIKLAFQLGVAFGMGRAWAKSRNMAMDADKWITVKPHGDVEGSGRPVLIDGETGTIKGGMGGKFTGQNIRQDWKQNNKSAQATSAQSGQNNGTNQQEGGAMEEKPKSVSVLNSLRKEIIGKGKMDADTKSSYQKKIQGFLDGLPVGTTLTQKTDAGVEEYTKKKDGDILSWSRLRQPFGDSLDKDSSDIAYFLMAPAWMKYGDIGISEGNTAKSSQAPVSNKVSDDNWESAPLGSVEDMLAYAAGVDGWANGAGPKGERLENALFDQGYKSFHGEIDGKPVKVGYRNGQWRFKGLDPDIDAEPDPYQDRVMEVLKQLHENGSLKKGLPKKATTQPGAVDFKNTFSKSGAITGKTWKALGGLGENGTLLGEPLADAEGIFGKSNRNVSYNEAKGRFVTTGGKSDDPTAHALNAMLDYKNLTDKYGQVNADESAEQAVNGLWANSSSIGGSAYLADAIRRQGGDGDPLPRIAEQMGALSFSTDDGVYYRTDDKSNNWRFVPAQFINNQPWRAKPAAIARSIDKAKGITDKSFYDKVGEYASQHLDADNVQKNYQELSNFFSKELGISLPTEQEFNRLSQKANATLRGNDRKDWVQLGGLYDQALMGSKRMGGSQAEIQQRAKEEVKNTYSRLMNSLGAKVQQSKTETSAHPWMNNFGLEDHPDVQKALNRHKGSSSAASRSRRKAGSEPADMDDDGRTMRQYLRNPQKSYDDLMKTVQWPESFPENKRKRLAELEAQTNFLQALVSGNDYERGHPVLKRYYDLLNEQRELNNELQEHFQRS